MLVDRLIIEQGEEQLDLTQFMSNKSIPGIYNSILAQDTGQIDDTNRYNENND